ncbi:peroxiredoxin (alkyl hydroperoxide reductase subunit C) [Tangfeifania diversioriginum]|uniref:Thioredoxin peroxidase n=2 Tax=Tangfeifania diversioriginum TaxID=1168035 RepID=A0A1M6HRG1_9BACT|nr:peroxiredoxin (alkyl hydroperoxide reductase subunit C) [Tangfeifania diversioriginum]
MAALIISAAAEGNKIPLIGSKAPSFTAESTNGKITFPESFGKSWKILFSHPQDFTPVCTSELLELAYLNDEFDAMDVKLAVISTDDLKMHKMWKAHLEDLDYKDRGKQKVNFPILDDHKAEASKIYGMLHEPVSTNKDIRGVFIIDANNIVRSVNFYPMEIGRNIDEILRIVAALKTTDESQVFTPANWNNGDDVLIPHFPYTAEQIANDPSVRDGYYSVGDRLWFKKLKK